MREKCEGKMRRRTLAVLVLIATGILFLLAKSSSAQRQSDLGPQSQRGATGADWPSHYGTNLAWRYSNLFQINTANVKRLLPAWNFQTGDYQVGLQSTPIVIDGVLYLSAMDDVFALDGATGRLNWQYKYQPVPGATVGRNFGVAVGDGKVFIGTADAHVVALDARTGHEVWKVAADDWSSCRCGIQAAPLLVKDKVIVGERGPRGRVSAFNARTGQLEWRFYTIPGPGEKGNESWAGDSWKNGNGNPWMTGSYDSDLNLVYWGVGDSTPAFYGAGREGSNLYTESVVALDAETGKLRWYYQEIPHDVWDYDAGWEMILMDREVSGRMRKLLVQFAKSGFAFVLDRETGELVKAYPYVDNINFVKGINEKGELQGRNEPVEDEVTLICPGNIGGSSWNQSAYSPRTGWAYVPALEMCNDLQIGPPAKYGGMGGSFVFNAPPGHDTAYSHLDAVDPVTGKRQWTYPYKFDLFASILATAGDLVMTGDPEGYFFALDARTGNKLWSFQTGAGNRGSPITYIAGGRQYIAVPTGWTQVGDLTTGIWPEAATWRHGSTLVVFALPEDSK
jgi:alcohol dehydrogenase (cytochrome c)